MSAPAASARQAQSPSVSGGALLAEQCGPHVLLSRGDETPQETTVLSSIPAVPGTRLFSRTGCRTRLDLAAASLEGRLVAQP